jgi:asparagine synthase (glutamine-hydrolysing)
MCGIAGFIRVGEAVDASELLQMTALIEHRGPDGQGTFIEGPLGLGHRRLSIVDRSDAGRQPMTYRDRYVITYNGEVYNHVELRRELESKGHRFHSRTDTEVILAAYDEWGDACLSRFNGMFAFALYDRARKRVLLVRDRFGIKPLYYWSQGPGAVCFASEVKQFSALKGWRPAPNRNRLLDYLLWGVTDHTDDTMFSSVFQLRAGCGAVLEWGSGRLSGLLESGKLETFRWYELPDSRDDGHKAASRFGELFEDSVRLQLRADVDVGSCLSGGLDSSSIVCVANRLLKSTGGTPGQKTFSACSQDPALDEREHVEEVVRATGVDAHYVYPDVGNLEKVLDRLIWHMDEPFGSTSCYAQWEVFALARANNVPVMLDGQGADEQLAGYHGYFAARLAGLFRSCRIPSLFREISGMKRLHGYGWGRSLAYLANGILPLRLRDWARGRLGRDNEAPSWLKEHRELPGDIRGLLYSEDWGDMRQLSRTKLLASHLPMLLRWEDRNSMAHSIEARVPFLDHRLVELVLSFPDSTKIHGGVTKLVLREAMEGVLPEKTRTRMDKKGFVTPEREWIANKWGTFADAALDAANHMKSLVNPEALARTVRRQIEGYKPFSLLPWRLICLNAWFKRFSLALPSN